MTKTQSALDVAQALLGISQNNRLLRLSFPNEDGPYALLLPNRLDADEALSRDFSFTVEVLSENARLALKDVEGKMVTISLVREDGTLRYFNGYVFEFALTRTDGGFAFYRMQLGPWLAYLRLRRDYYLFHGKTVQQQTAEIFADYPLPDWQTRLHGDDPVLTDACQAAETDYNYVHRRWEQRGWHYWYEHRADGHTLVLSDDSTGADPIDGVPTIAFQREAGALEDDAIGDWSPVRRIVPASVALSSFDFKAPRPQSATLPTIHQQGDVPQLEVYEYTGAYGFSAGDDGNALARRRMEEIEAGGKRFEAAGNDRTVQPGRWFQLTGHFDIDPDGSNSQDSEFLIVQARHSASNNYHANGSQPAQYSNTLTCLRKTIPWRPGRGYNSSEPKLYGLQTATVVGPAGEEIHTDEYGRIRVQFHWDREGQFDDKSSAWVRVATPWSGSNFGMTSIPRIGTEVIVQFLDGNPDRPLVTGMVPNAQTMPPWTLPDNKTQSGILSRSTPGGAYGNANAIRFEDKKGAEQLWLHAEKDQLTEVEHDEDKWVGNDRRKTIDHDETSHIKHDRTETVDHDETITVHNDRKERVDHNETISIGDNRTEDVGKNETIDIGGTRNVTIGHLKIETVGLAKIVSIGGAYQTSVGAAMNTTVALMQAEQVGLSKTVTVGQKISFTAGEEFRIEVGASTFVMRQDGRIEISGKEIIIRGSKKVELHGDDVDTNPEG
ncbi:type VI secretion system tip protein VgrG [Duganella sp. FT92W]|uniref:Type VI secretion system tip protein VgrG n=1 Tax=Pseudoduganella rivuli TaxID=2666085 RepID=A0A7X2IUE2_9BURK|nr:type VI secretion system tip protein TssI/VgrG [Pseudoduganella rivuli]MRV75982.1 type VI secretion system tip protein VgrG [Pseudoduganella rivuli]